MPLDSLDGTLLPNQLWTFLESHTGRFKGHFTVFPLFIGFPDVFCIISLHRFLGNRTPPFPPFAKNLLDLVAPISVKKHGTLPQIMNPSSWIPRIYIKVSRTANSHQHHQPIIIY